jgi:hypothetical protein
LNSAALPEFKSCLWYTFYFVLGSSVEAAPLLATFNRNFVAVVSGHKLPVSDVPVISAKPFAQLPSK